MVNTKTHHSHLHHHKAPTHQRVFGHMLKVSFFTSLLLSIFFAILSVFYLIFEYRFQNRIYPHVLVEGIDMGGKTKTDVTNYYLSKNIPFHDLTITFTSPESVATLSGAQLELGFDATLSAQQAYLIGRSPYLFSNFAQKLSAFKYHINLKPLFRFEEDKLETFLEEQAITVMIPVQEALFAFENNRVTAFKPSKPGRQLNKELVKKKLNASFSDLAAMQDPQLSITIPFTIETIEPTTTTNTINSFGIKERIGIGESYFRGSIANRIYNLSLAAGRVNGLLIPPQTVFSLNSAVGDISATTGYKQAYVIKSGRTVLDDGGGVCQVSTTFFRAAMNAGLPIIERSAHSYRVGYYEQGGWGPGYDATIYAPSYDLKIKNDTPTHILIQTYTDSANARLVFELYGTSDGRIATIGKARIWDTKPAPIDIYQDDPSLPAGTIKQVDWAAPGAKTAFDYVVSRNGTELLNKTFFSNFIPWQAIYLKGVGN